jgi:hypothetical protein
VVILEAADPERAIPLPPDSEPLVEVATGANATSSSPMAPHGCACACAMRSGRPVPALLDTLRSGVRASARRCCPLGAGDARDRLQSTGPRPHRLSTCALCPASGIHDALEAGASSRDLAFGLVFPTIARLSERLEGIGRAAARAPADRRCPPPGRSGYRKLLVHTAETIGQVGVTELHGRAFCHSLGLPVHAIAAANPSDSPLPLPPFAGALPWMPDPPL